MTTRELYFKVKYLADAPVARMMYTFKGEDGSIQLLGGSLCISFRDNMEETFKRIEDVEKVPGFMFWNNSPEGEKWLKDNWDVIGKQLSNMVINQK